MSSKEDRKEANIIGVSSPRVNRRKVQVAPRTWRWNKHPNPGRLRNSLQKRLFLCETWRYLGMTRQRQKCTPKPRKGREV
jgi:hypothetical protein